MRPLLHLLPVFLGGCSCADAFSQGSLTVVTDCVSADGTPQRAVYPFVKFPDAAASGLQSYFGINLSDAEKSIAADLDCPSPDGFTCQPRGGGLDTKNTTDVVTAGAALCGSKLIAVGPLPDQDGIYVCSSTAAAVEGQLWALDCKRLTSGGVELSTCKALASFRTGTGI